MARSWVLAGCWAALSIPAAEAGDAGPDPADAEPLAAARPEGKGEGEGAFPLPLDRIFVGRERFDEVVAKAVAENWRSRPIGDRVVSFAREFHHVPYRSFTLEIDDRVESPSVNLSGMDCWTFFETSLGLARMIAVERDRYRPEDLLEQIEFTRYRGGRCTGDYLERIHYLAEWFFENDARGTIEHLTGSLPGSQRIRDRKIQEMTVLWKSYRYLRENPGLREPMREWEAYVAQLPVRHIPKREVAALEGRLRDGDVIGIATNQHGGFCSHVGIAVRTSDGVMRLMHASSNYRKVVIDQSISDYLREHRTHAGILVGRPIETGLAVRDEARYRANLEKLLQNP